MARFALPRPRTLFGKTLLTIAVVSIGFQIFTLAVIGYWMLVPVGQRSADDLAALMIGRATEWAALPPEGRDRLTREVVAEHDILLRRDMGEVQPRAHESWLPYAQFLQNALKARLGRSVRLWSVGEGNEEWFWVNLPIGGEPVQAGFPRSRIGVRPPLVFALLLSVGAGVTLLTAVVLARRLTTPLERLSSAARRLGRGQWPEPLPEEGAEELISLAHTFNRMSHQVQELLANRTTLLAGISHDLRTPLTRIRLAIAMLEKEADPNLIKGVEDDLAQMDALIGQFLQLGRDLDREPSGPQDVTELVSALVADVRRGGASVRWNPQTPCVREVHALALRRILANLIDNAVRYAGGAVELVLHCMPRGAVRIEVRDRGPGIPKEHRHAVFRPFFRIEQSRSAQTGGSGLGLAIAAQLAEVNGWHIQLLPRRGGGTVARVDIG